MGIVQIVANRSGAGKTCLVSALLSTLLQQGKKTAYYKPFSVSAGSDPDVAFMAQKLLPADSPPVPAPQSLPTGSSTSVISDATDAIKEAVSGLQNAGDTVLLEGPDLTLTNGESWPGAAAVAAASDAKVVLMVSYERGADANAVAALAEPFGERLAGLVINHCPVHRRHQIAETLVAPLRQRRLTVLGAIPEDRFMLSVTVRQIIEHLNGSWVQEPEHTDAHVNRFLIGGNIMDSGPNYFGRYSHQAVITRAERPDIQMASLAGDTKCLVLTGGEEPTEYIRVEANKKGVPLISVNAGTMDTAEALTGLLERANPHSLVKVRRFSQLIQEHLDLEALNAALA